MEDHNFINRVKALYRVTMGILVLTLMLIVSLVYFYADPSLSIFQNSKTPSQIATINTPPIEVEDPDRIENGIHVRTGLKEGEGLMLVVQNCTACHSAKMITQNKASKEGWKSMIRWMQETQNLWDLGANEEAIITYLATNYPPEKKGRRAPLKNVEWYELD